METVLCGALAFLKLHNQKHSLPSSGFDSLQGSLCSEGFLKTEFLHLSPKQWQVCLQFWKLRDSASTQSKVSGLVTLQYKKRCPSVYGGQLTSRSQDSQLFRLRANVYRGYSLSCKITHYVWKHLFGSIYIHIMGYGWKGNWVEYCVRLIMPQIDILSVPVWSLSYAITGGNKATRKIWHSSWSLTWNKVIFVAYWKKITLTEGS